MSARARALAFWQEPEVVEQFAARPPDHRLQRLATTYVHPPRVRVLDLGCAGGRNTRFLIERGFDVTALDFSPAMVEATRARVAALRGPEEAAVRVRLGGMDDLDGIPDRSVDLIVALGIYHGAASEEEWDRALAESSRVAARGGLVLVANHGAGYDPEGPGLSPVPGVPFLFDGMRSGRSFLFDAPTHDRRFGRCGFVPWIPTETVRRETDTGGVRVTVNALYRRT
jgi:SAM-dependent methyltransferase